MKNIANRILIVCVILSVAVPMTAMAGTKTLDWSSGSDWDNGTDASNVVHSDSGDRNNSELALGIPHNGTTLGAYYPMDENSGSTSHDASGTHDGNVNGSISWASASYLGIDAPKFDGVDDEINTTYEPTAGNRTLIISFKTGINHTTVSPLISSTDSEGVIRFESDDKIYGYIGNAGSWNSVSSTSTYNDSKWHTAAFVIREGEEIALFVDGAKVASKTPSLNPEEKNYPVYIGGHATQSQYYEGHLSSAAVYTSALSDSKIKALTSSSSGYHKSDIKSFGESYNPDLESTSTLNNQDVNVTVIGSPGTSESESHTVPLDGSGSYDISWASKHSDFRLKTDLSTSNLSKSPIVSGLSLAQVVSSSSTTSSGITVTLGGSGVFASSGSDFDSVAAMQDTHNGLSHIEIEGFYNSSDVGSDVNISIPDTKESSETVTLALYDSNALPVSNTTNVTMTTQYPSDSLFYYKSDKPLTTDDYGYGYVNKSSENATVHTVTDADGQVAITAIEDPDAVDKVMYKVRTLLVKLGF